MRILFTSLYLLVRYLLYIFLDYFVLSVGLHLPPILFQQLLNSQQLFNSLFFLTSVAVVLILTLVCANCVMEP